MTLVHFFPRVNHRPRKLVQPASGAAFVGASPERLYRRELDFIRTEAIAGSRPRGLSPDQDQAFSHELITNEKDLREHGYVVQYIHEALTDLCSVSEANAKPSLLKLTRCQHLLTTFRGTLRRNVKDADLLERLHPTPAVGGWPTDRTIDDISRLEFFDRGWYAGPVGWISRDAEQFVVGIRAPGSLKAPACTSSQAQASWTGQFQKMSGTRSKTKSVIFSLCSTHRYSLSDITTNLQ